MKYLGGLDYMRGRGAGKFRGGERFYVENPLKTKETFLKIGIYYH